MVNSGWSYTVLFYDKSDSWSNSYITDDVDEIPLFTDTSDRQINYSRLLVNAKNGQYIKSGVNSKPKIDVFDRILITVNDGAGGAYARYFDVVKRIPIKSKGSGTKLQLELEGTERWLQKINYSKPHYFSTASEVLTDIVNNYNDNKGTDLPTLSIGTNELPSTGVIHVDFGINEETTYNRIFDLTDLMAAPATSGGVLDFFDVRFVTTTYNTIQLNVFSSGSPSSGSEVTINSSNVNTGESDGGLEGQEANIINAWGNDNAGSLPVEFSKFRSREILLPTSLADDSAFASWSVGNRPYQQGSIVTYGSAVYTSDIDNNNSTPGVSNWTVLTPETYYGGTIQYSPWTDNKAAHIKNSGGDPSLLNWPFSGTAKGRMWDINVIINDDTTFCVDVDLKSTTSTLNAYWLYNAAQSGKYDGLTVLVAGTGTGDFTGFDNKIMEYINGSWRVKYDPQTDMMCSVYDEGKVYKYSGSAWVDITTQAGGSWCFHPYSSIGQAESVFKDADTGNEYLSNNTGSSVKITYTWSNVEAFVESTIKNILPLVTWASTPNYYQVGAWFNLRFPYPINTYNSISGTIGNVYGGSTTDSIVPYLDSQNMHLTPDGKRGYNQGSSTEALGPLNSLDFWIKLSYLDSYGNTRQNRGNFKMRCGLIDSSDHVVYQDFIISHNDNWQPVKLPLSGFQIYRGRRPRFNSGFISDLVPPKGITYEDVFEWQHVKGLVIQTQDSYDEFGRYTGGGGFFGVDNLDDTSTIELYIDALRFTKPLLVNSGQITDTSMESDFLQKPEFTNYELLTYDVKAELERQKFENKQYDIETEGKFDVDFGDFFLFNDDEIIDESDTASDTVKLVAKHIEYSITKPINNSGGFLRRIRGARRFV